MQQTSDLNNAQLIAQPSSPILHPMKPELFNQPPRFMHMKYINVDVVTAAKARLNWIVDNFDEPWVSFSGGKDSLVCLTLMEQVYAERGWLGKKPINVKFMDEELVCDDIIDFVLKKADYGVERGWYNFRWYALNMYVGYFVMGKHRPFVSWDKSRTWHRQLPDRPYVITSLGEGIDTKECNENNISQHMYLDTSKTYAEILGLRADESQKRFMSVKNGGVVAPNYLSNGIFKHIYAAKPIYDWTELDIFKFFKEYNVEYCPYYDVQVWAKSPLRVASALHERGMAQFMKLKEIAPKFYENMREVYPDIETHYRYYNEMASDDKAIYSYPRTFQGIRDYIEEHLDEGHKPEALKFVNSYETRRINTLKKHPEKVLGGVSLLQVWRGILGGRFVKAATLMHDISQADIDYELGH